MVAVLKLSDALHRGSVVGLKTHRVIQEHDIPWMSALAKTKYPGNYDMEAAEMWVRNVVLRQPMLFYPVRTDHAFCITIVTIMPWTPGEPEANIVMMCAEDGWVWDSVRLARVSFDWAIRRNCFKWGFNSDTEFEIGPIAKRMGIVERCPRYVVNLK